MEELVQLVSTKTGATPEQARAAVETVLGFLKERLPAPMAAQVDSLFAGGAVSTDNMNAAIQGLGGLFGRR